MGAGGGARAGGRGQARAGGGVALAGVPPAGAASLPRGFRAGARRGVPPRGPRRRSRGVPPGGVGITSQWCGFPRRSCPKAAYGGRTAQGRLRPANVVPKGRQERHNSTETEPRKTRVRKCRRLGPSSPARVGVLIAAGRPSSRGRGAPEPSSLQAPALPSPGAPEAPASHEHMPGAPPRTARGLPPCPLRTGSFAQPCRGQRLNPHSPLNLAQTKRNVRIDTFISAGGGGAHARLADKPASACGGALRRKLSHRRAPSRSHLLVQALAAGVALRPGSLVLGDVEVGQAQRLEDRAVTGQRRARNVPGGVPEVGADKRLGALRVGLAH